MPENTAEGIILPLSEREREEMDETELPEKHRLFEETLKSLDANISEEDILKGRITYAQMFSKLPPEMQATIKQYYTKRDTIASAIIGGHNRLLQNKKYGIADSPTLPMTTTLWKRRRPLTEGRPPLPPESDFKKRAAGDPS
jgi:hypothetical protein